MQNFVLQTNPRTGEKEFGRTQFYVTSAHARDLKKVLEIDFPSKAPVPIRFVLSVLVDVGSALLHCYYHLVVHMDVKPENILIDGTKDAPHAVLCDFGCALRLKDSTMIDLPTLNRLDGNDLYRSPELRNAFIQQRPPHFKKQPSFELGTLGYEMLICKHPVKDYGLVSAPFKYTDEDIQDLSEDWCPNRDLAQLLRELVQFEPENRLELETAVNRLKQLYEMQIKFENNSR